MKVLLTGATGFIGSHTAELLLQQGHDVRCLARSTANMDFLKKLGPGIELCLGSLDNSDILRQAVTDREAIIHCAGTIKVRHADDYFVTNLNGTQALLAATKKYAPDLQRFVFVSSMAACGAALNNTHSPTNDFLPKPISQYGQSKLAAEILTKEYSAKIPITIIRPTVVYGPRDLSTLTFFKAIQRGFIPLSKKGVGIASTIYVTDVAHALLHAMVRDVPSGSAYFLEDGDPMTWRERYYQLATHIGKNNPIEIPIPELLINCIATCSEMYARISHKPVLLTRDKCNELKQLNWVCSSANAQQDLLWKPTTNWLNGTKQAHDWYKSEGWL